MTYNARNEKGLIAFMLLFPLGTCSLEFIMKKIAFREILLIGLIEYLIIAFIIIALSSVKYTLTEHELIISRLGIKSHLAYENMEAIIEKRGLLRVEAPSAMQVCIVRTDGVIVKVSPEKAKDFIDTINKKIGRHK